MVKFPYINSTLIYVAVLGHGCEMLHYTDSSSSLYRNKDFPLKALAILEEEITFS